MIHYNPCSTCKTDKTVQEIVHTNEPMVDGEYLSHVWCRKCGKKTLAMTNQEFLAKSWNWMNPTGQSDKEKLAECHKLLEAIASKSCECFDGLLIQQAANDLLTKHRSVNNV